jgi:hypothetical protein
MGIGFWFLKEKYKVEGFNHFGRIEVSNEISYSKILNDVYMYKYNFTES